MKKIIWAILATASLAGAQPLTTRGGHYRLQSEDKIEVLYRYTPEYNATVALQPDGYVSLPLIGEVKVSNLTLEEVAALVRVKAGERLADPDVTVVLKDYVKPYFVVAGEVGRPGRFEFHGKVSLIEAIAIGGGVKDSAKRTQVVLVHRPGGEMAEVRVVDLRKLMSPGKVLEDIEIQSGDMIVVPRNALSKVEPYIRVSELGLTSILLGLK